MTTASNSAILDPVTNPVLTVAPQNKEDTTMSGATNKITALYCRLSQEDARLGESLSIENQKVILLEYAKKNHFPNPVFFVDDGYSGTNYDRPGFQSMLVEIEAGRALPGRKGLRVQSGGLHAPDPQGPRTAGGAAGKRSARPDLSRA